MKRYKIVISPIITLILLMINLNIYAQNNVKSSARMPNPQDSVNQQLRNNAKYDLFVKQHNAYIVKYYRSLKMFPKNDEEALESVIKFLKDERLNNYFNMPDLLRQIKGKSPLDLINSFNPSIKELMSALYTRLVKLPLKVPGNYNSFDKLMDDFQNYPGVSKLNSRDREMWFQTLAMTRGCFQLYTSNEFVQVINKLNTSGGSSTYASKFNWSRLVGIMAGDALGGCIGGVSEAVTISTLMGSLL